MKTFFEYLAEDQKTDLYYRNVATKLANVILLHLKRTGNKTIKVGDLTKIKQAQNISVEFTPSAAQGSFQLDKSRNGYDVTIQISDGLLKNLPLLAKTLVHELIHALDISRIPGKSLEKIINKDRNVDIERYVNDPLELNAYYQELVFSIELDGKHFSNLKTFIQYAMKKLPVFFVDNLTEKNKKKILSRLAIYFEEHFNS